MSFLSNLFRSHNSLSNQQVKGLQKLGFNEKQIQEVDQALER